MNDNNSRYIDENGQITMCGTCRKVKDDELWVLDTVLYVQQPDNVIYINCPDCFEKK